MLVEAQVRVFHLDVSARDIGGGVGLVIEVDEKPARAPGRKFDEVGERFDGHLWAGVDTRVGEDGVGEHFLRRGGDGDLYDSQQYHHDGQSGQTLHHRRFPRAHTPIVDYRFSAY